MNPDWITQFNEREQKEINFALLYARDFAHGTDGHNAKMIIAKLVKMLDGAHSIEREV